MPFNDALFNSLATRGELAGAIVKVSIALESTAKALEGIRAGDDVVEHIAEIRKRSNELSESFDKLTGYFPGPPK